MLDHAEQSPRPQQAGNLPREGYPALLGDMMINANSGHKIEAGVAEGEHIGQRLVLHFDRRRTGHLLGRITADGARKARPAERQQFSFAAPHVQPSGIRGGKLMLVQKSRAWRSNSSLFAFYKYTVPIEIVDKDAVVQQREFIDQPRHTLATVGSVVVEHNHASRNESWPQPIQNIFS